MTRKSKGYTVAGDFIYAGLEGSQELLQAMELLCGESEKVLEEALQEGAEVIRRAAASNEPGADIQTDFIDEHLKGVITPGNRKTIAIGPSKKKWAYTYIETGVQPHEVNAKDTEALLMYQAQGQPYAKSMQHPGIVARPFLRPAFDANTGAAIRKFEEVVWKAFNRILKGR